MTTVELNNQLSKHNKSLIEKEQTPEVDFFYIPENNQHPRRRALPRNDRYSILRTNKPVKIYFHYEMFFYGLYRDRFFLLT